MDQDWIHTPQGNWLYTVDDYCGIIVNLGSTWSARIEDKHTVYPADVTFPTRADAQG